MSATILETSLADLPVRRGKVRDIYDLGDTLLLVSTDRISAFDWVLPTGIPDKGKVLTALTLFWLKYLDVPNHFLSADVKAMPEAFAAQADVLQGRSMLVKKTGRTTHFTTGRVTALNATVNVGYGGGKVAKFVNQIITTDMSAGGDSGSLVLDWQNRPVGLLFAGSSVATILNPIATVQLAFYGQLPAQLMITMVAMALGLRAVRDEHVLAEQERLARLRSEAGLPGGAAATS